MNSTIVEQSKKINEEDVPKILTEKEKIMNEIKRLEKELEEVKGTKCEIYSRIVGYFRPIKDWNNGKREEFGERVTFNVKEKKDVA